MKQLTQTIDKLKNSYDPQEFFPIMAGDRLLNRSDFIRYKLRCIVVKHTLV